MPAGIIGPGLLVVAGFFDGTAQLSLWGLALFIDYVGVLFQDIRTWRISPAHPLEHHGLVVIIGLGESIFAIGVGATGTPLSTGVIVAALLGIAIAAAL